MKKLFLDCGTNLGQGLQIFNKKYDLFNNNNWEIYTFEPNPYINLDNLFTNVTNINKIPKAIWIEDCKLEFNCKGKNYESDRIKHGEDRYQGGGSQIKSTDKQVSIPEHVELNSVYVDAFDFSKFLRDIHSNYSEVIVKMDVEGAEFDIIDKLIEDDTLRFISTLFIEPHGRFKFQRCDWTKEKESIHKIETELIDKCKQHTNVHLWD